MKKLTCLVLVLILLMTLIVQAYGLSFIDIENHWAEENISKWTEEGLINGYEDGSFKPNGKITGKEFGFLVQRKLGLEFQLKNEEMTRLDVAVLSFQILKSLGNDLDSDDDGTDDLSDEEIVLMIQGAGILKGYPDGTMKLDRPVTRAESLIVLERIASYMEEKEEENSEAELFSDVYTVDGYMIRDIPFTTDLEKFKENIYVSDGATYEIFKFDEETFATRITNGYKVFVTSEDEITTNIYMIDKNSNPVRPDPVEEVEEEKVTIEINYIEELAMIGIKDDYPLDGNYILMRDLDFNDYDSYTSAAGITYGDLNGDGTTEAAIEEFTTIYLEENEINIMFNPTEDGWMPIGNEENPFIGDFDGNEKTISNLYINRYEENQGFFGVTDGAKIYDLNIGRLEEEKIDDFKVKGIAYNGQITSNGNSAFLIGKSYSSIIENCSLTGNFSNRTEGIAGGLIGSAYDSQLKNLNIEGNGELYLHSMPRGTAESEIINAYGSIVGLVSSTTIENCYNTARIMGYNNTGGIVGQLVNDSIIEESYNSAYVEGYQSVGGIAGLSTSNSTIVNSYNTARIRGYNNTGGIVGKSLDSNFINLYSTYITDYLFRVKRVESNNGGILGYDDGGNNFENCYWDEQKMWLSNYSVGNKSTTVAGITAYTTNPMTKESNSVPIYENWDFDNIWFDCDINDGPNSYPYLRNNEQLPHPTPRLDEK